MFMFGFSSINMSHFGCFKSDFLLIELLNHGTDSKTMWFLLAMSTLKKLHLCFWINKNKKNDILLSDG